jgi:pyruvate dehydrogenase E2 component (dihydrolipoamide acetyltransferase)
MSEVGMPKLSDSMEEGTILKWLRADGDEIKRGDELVEIETDKVNMSYEADEDGLLTILAPEGTTVSVGEPIATIVAAQAEVADTETTKTVEREAEAPRANGPEVAAGGRHKGASVVARRLARNLGVSLTDLTGTGPRGRILKTDVKAAATTPSTLTLESSSADATWESLASVEELTRLQQTVARRTTESKASAPDFTLTVEVDMDDAVSLRRQLKTLAGENSAAVPTINDFVIKASALALREFPRANGSYRDGHFELHPRVNIGIAVAAHDSLIVPTIFDADEKTLDQIAAETRALAERVRAQTTTPPELEGGTFTVSNLGMYGITRFAAVINPPQAAILAVGQVTPRAVVVKQELTAKQQADLSLTCDHRILYGADAAQFLARIKSLLENPIGLVL